MLSRLELVNFFSVRSTALHFPRSGVSALIGPNGSGKSNIIKAVEFIADLAEKGLQLSQYAAGGRETILPKAIAKGALNGKATRICYEFELTRPDIYPTTWLPPSVRHEIEFKIDRRNSVSVITEMLEFREPLSVVAAMHARRDKTDLVQSEQNPSAIRLQRDKTGVTSYVFTPDISEVNSAHYVQWLGLSSWYASLKKDSKTPEALGLIIASLAKSEKAKPKQSLLESGATFIGTYGKCKQFEYFKAILSRTCRYDIQLSELRSEQTISGELLGKLGQRLPSAIQDLKRKKKQAHARVMATMAAIAPHLGGPKVQALRSGKEFVQFLEYQSGRPVESWNSSDGTLRALAILIAVESAVSDQTILIEEPEQGLHPWAIREVIRHMREVAKVNDVQIILTTHSQQVLEALAPDEVFVLSRGAQSGTVCVNLAESHPAMNIGDIGRMWVKGLLGGVPVYEQ